MNSFEYSRRPQILYVTADMSWPPSIGGHIRRWNVLQGLLASGEVDAAVFRGANGELSHQSFAGCRQIIDLRSRHLQFSNYQRKQYESTIGRGLMTLGTALPFEYQGEALAELRGQIRQDVDLQRYDLVWFATARTVVPFGRLGAVSAVLDGDDFGYVREWLQLTSTPWHGAKIWNYLDVAKLWLWERGLASRFSYVVRCSKEDQARHPAPNVVVIPNGASVPSTVDRTPEGRVLFVGDLGYAPNSEGVEWFLEAVWPLVRQCFPSAAFDIVGRNPSQKLKDAHEQCGVHVHGFVKNLEPLFRRASLSVTPLHAGGGTRLKILESLANAVPVVSTDIGAFGISADSRHGLDRAETPEQFLQRIGEILRNGELAQARANAGREFVRTNYDWRVIRGKVRELVLHAVGIEEVVNQRDSSSELVSGGEVDDHRRGLSADSHLACQVGREGLS